MKTLTKLLLILTIALGSCKKNKNENPQPTTTPINHSYTLKVYGECVCFYIDTATTGTGIVLPSTSVFQNCTGIVSSWNFSSSSHFVTASAYDQCGIGGQVILELRKDGVIVANDTATDIATIHGIY